MATPQTQLVVVIPAAARDDAADTVASVLHYGGPATVAVVQDDTGGDLAHLADGRRVHVRQARGPARGVGGSLWAKLAETYAWALAELDPAIVMKLDADALMTGPGLGDLAAARFAADPALGMLGSYAIGPDGGERDWRPAAIAIRAQAGLRGLREPALWRRTRAVLAAARRHGYTDGEHVLGAASLISADALRAVQRHGWLEPGAFARSRMPEDWIFPLTVVAAGYRIADFGGPGQPLGVRWRGLPASPEQLLAEGRLVVHSVRSYGDLDEAAIRAAFAAARAAEQPVP